MRQCLASHGNGYRQRHRPHIKSQVLCRHYPPVYPRHQIPDKPSQEQRHNQQRKHLIYNNSKGRNKRQSCLRMSHRQKQRTKQCHHHIYYNGIRSGGSRVTTELLRHHCASRGRGAYNSQHKTLDYNPRPRIGISPKKKASDRKQQALRQQQPRVPRVRFQVRRLDLTESHKQHNKQQHRLQHLRHSQHVRLHLVRQRQCPAHQITQCPANHSHRQSPVLQKLNQTHNAKSHFFG